VLSAGSRRRATKYGMKAAGRAFRLLLKQLDPPW
jgi:hypothetical protein